MPMVAASKEELRPWLLADTVLTHRGCLTPLVLFNNKPYALHLIWQLSLLLPVMETF